MFLYFNPYIFGTTGPGPVVYPASGGTITQVGSYTIHTFLSSGTFTVLSSALACDILVVAGGGGGGGYVGGGGGGGGVQYFVNQNLAATAYTVTVGTGGAGATSGSTWPANGGNSQFGTLTPSVGGGAGGSSNAGNPIQGTYPAGTAGGSGGGGVNSGAGGAGTPGQGNAGSGSGYGGGGGAGAASTTFNGGSGLANSITGTNVYYAGGGGAYSGTIGGAGGTGGVGGGGASISGGGVAGTANTGGGGGGTTSNTGGANGGSGIVIVRYLTVAVPIYIMDYVSAIANATGLYACKRLLTSYLGPVMRLTDPATVLLLHCDNPSTNSTTVGGYIDSSSYNNLITNTGSVVYSTTPTPLPSGTSCIFVNNSYIQTPSSVNFTFGNKNFTIEFWMYIVTKPGSNTGIIGNNIINSNSGAWGIYTDGTNIYSQWAGNTLVFGNFPYLSSYTGNWNHYAYVRNGATTTVYVNGISVVSLSNFGTSSIDSGTGSNTITVGSWPPTLGGINAYFDEIRISKGVARYTANFSPATFPGIGTPVTDSSFPNVALLLHCDGNNGVAASSSAYYDSSPLNALMSVSGPPTFSSTQKKFGVSSLSFNNSYLQTPTNANYVLGSKDFTIEFWIYLTGTPSGNISIFGNSLGSVNYGISLYYNGTTNLVLYYYNGTTQTNWANLPSWDSNWLNNWTHFALVRNGTSLLFYVNGVLSVTNAVSGSMYTSGTDYLTFGSNPTRSFTGFTGYLDDIRVTIGTARYTSNFSVPTSAFPDLPTGPVATDFYSDPNGNLNTKVDGSGTTYTSWANINQVAFAPVLTWYDQSTTANHARAFPGSWPVYDPANNLVDLTTSVTGLYGGSTSTTSSSGTYMMLPDGTVPGGNPNFTMTAKHGVAPSGPTGTYGYGTILTAGVSGSVNNIVNLGMVGSTTFSYIMNTWGTNPTYQPSNSIMPGNIVTFTCATGGVTNEYVNGVVSTNSPITLGSTPNISTVYNVIGGMFGAGYGQYFNGQLNFLSIFNSVLSTVDRAIVESQGNYFDPYYYNTVLLLKGDSQISSTTTTTTIVDSSLYNATMVNSGATIASLGTFPNGNKTFANPMLFNGSVSPSGNYLQTPSSSLYTLGSKDFTIECWIYFTSTPGAVNTQILTNSTTTGGFTQANIWNLYYYNGASTYLTFQLGNAGPQSIYNGVALSNSTWYHIAVTRSSNNFNMYVNGTRYFSTSPASTLITYSGSVDSGLAQQISIGGATYTSAYSFPGYIDDVRVTNGVARYLGNFNVPLGPSSAIAAALPIATGGTVSGPVTIDGSSYMIHQFLQTGASTFELNQTAVCDILVVAGGGGAGNGGSGGGGGGGGGVRYASRITLQPGTYNVTVGSGGLGGGGSSSVPTQGGNSSFGSLIDSTGGGYSAYQNSGGTYIAAGSGGSGGGGISGNTAGGQPIYGQGYLGGTYASGSTGGGGGGAGGAGGGSGNSLGTNGNDGGPGAASSITGITLYYGGGGGGGNNTTTGLGGIGGGGGSSRTTNGGNGIANTGGGGQGQGANGTSGNGGSGIVIVRYPVVTPIATITNPSVEFTTTPSSGWTGGLMSNASGTTCIGWTFTGTAGAATILNPSLTPATYGSVGAKDGVNVIYISANASTAVGTIANLVIGSVYIVRLWVLSPPIAGSNGGNSFTVTVNTSSATTTIYSSTAITNTTSWTQITCQSFTATSTTHTLTLAGNIASKSVMIDALTIAISTNPMIINPSLEATTPIAPTSWQVSYNARIPPGTACAGWTLYGTGASIVNNNIQSTNWGPATFDGNAVVILNVYAASAPWPTPTAYGTIENLSIGVSYVVYMSITNRNVSSTGGTFTAFVNTTPSQTTIYSPTSITWQSWQYTACTSFTATSTSHTLALQATTTTQLDSSICIDSITVAIPRSTPASPTLLGYWDFTNAANYNGSSVTDLSTNGVNLTWMGGGTPSYTTTGAMCANLTDNISYLQSNTEAPWGGSVLTSGFTFECLVKVTSLDTSTSFPSLMGYGGANSLPYFNIVTGNSGGWYWQAGTTNSAWYMYGPSPINSQPSTTAWSHLVFVCKPTGNQSIIYVNGVAISLLSGGGTNIVVGPDKLFYLGTCAVNGSTGLAPTRTGKIYLAMARMYSGILPATGTVSVVTNYNQYKNMSGNPYAI